MPHSTFTIQHSPFNISIFTEESDTRHPAPDTQHRISPASNLTLHTGGFMRAVRTRLWSVAALLVLAASLNAQDLASFEKRTTVRKLDNGLTVIILERHEA